jgi:hypothetical protein
MERSSWLLPNKNHHQSNHIIMNGNTLINVEDVLYPSDNFYEIPCLRMDRQPRALRLPLSPYGLGRKTKEASTIHFYVDDYRFESVWRNPAKILAGNVSDIIEPNFSLFDTTPLAYGIHLIYKKRWIARYLQECGINVYVDLNVSSKFDKFNIMGVPSGYNAFATRGTRGFVDRLNDELKLAQDLSGLEIPNLIVYGGGKAIQEFCTTHSLLYIYDYMTAKKESNG